MSRESGNIVYPEDMFGTVGADAARLYLLGSPVWQTIDFSAEEVRRTMVGTLIRLLRLYLFFASNANAYGYSGQRGGSRTHDLDMWIVSSRLNTTVLECRAGFDSREVHRSVRAVESFTENLSNWYGPAGPAGGSGRRATRRTGSRPTRPSTSAFSRSQRRWRHSPPSSRTGSRSLGGPSESVHLDDYPVAETGR